MIAAGALEEAGAVLARSPDPSLPMMKALGLPPLLAHLRGEMTLEAAISRACADTRAYAKRQSTWFRHQLNNAIFIDAQFSERLIGEILPKIRSFLLTAQ
jgi:tRNA dimethylallyltransferase